VAGETFLVTSNEIHIPAPKKKIISLFFYCWLSLYVIYHSIENFSNSCSSIISVPSINGFELETEMR
jgi:hypothetical protein